MNLNQLKQELADAKDNGQSSIEIAFEDIDKLVAVAEAAKACVCEFIEPLTPEELDLKAALAQLETSDEGGEDTSRYKGD